MQQKAEVDANPTLLFTESLDFATSTWFKRKKYAFVLEKLLSVCNVHWNCWCELKNLARMLKTVTDFSPSQYFAGGRIVAHSTVLTCK